jgi:WD40 repeat protein
LVIRTVRLRFGALREVNQFVNLYFNLDAWEAHSKAVTQMHFDDDTRVLVTGGKDRAIKYWKLPERWTSEEIENFEEREIKVMNLFM